MHNEFRVGLRHNSNSNGESSRREIFELNGFVNNLPARFSLPLVSPLVNDSTPFVGSDYITTSRIRSPTFAAITRSQFGGNFRDTQRRERAGMASTQEGILGLPRYTIGVATGDPLASVFSTSTIPGLSPNDRAAFAGVVRALDWSVEGSAHWPRCRCGHASYSDDVPLDTWTSAWFAGFFVQDSWRVKPNITLNYGLRYEINAPPFSSQWNRRVPRRREHLSDRRRGSSTRAS